MDAGFHKYDTFDEVMLYEDVKKRSLQQQEQTSPMNGRSVNNHRIGIYTLGNLEKRPAGNWRLVAS